MRLRYPSKAPRDRNSAAKTALMEDRAECRFPGDRDRRLPDRLDLQALAESGASADACLGASRSLMRRQRRILARAVRRNRHPMSALRRTRNDSAATPANPASIMAQVDASGTTVKVSVEGNSPWNNPLSEPGANCGAASLPT